MAHEMGHAKLIQRGFRKIVLNGVARCSQMTRGLRSIRLSARESKRGFPLVETLAAVAGPLARAACKLAAKYMRQEEFAADRLAAEICGPSACIRAMRATVIASVKGANLTFRERLMHLERNESFTEWLRSRLTPATEEERAELTAKGFADRQSSALVRHPSPSDRLAMWGDDSCESPTSDEPATGLIKDPDFVAKRLADEIERVIGGI